MSYEEEEIEFDWRLLIAGFVMFILMGIFLYFFFHINDNQKIAACISSEIKSGK